MWLQRSASEHVQVVFSYRQVTQRSRLGAHLGLEDRAGSIYYGKGLTAGFVVEHMLVMQTVPG